jgi:hypothetical protein
VIIAAAARELELETPDPDPDPVGVGEEDLLVDVLVYVSFCARYSSAIPMIGASEPSVFVMGVYSVVL